MAVSRLACAYLKAGNTAAGEKQIESLKQRMKSEYVPASVFIPYYTSRDDNDQAFKWLEKACNEKDVFLLMYMIPYEKLYPFPDDPRFTSLLERVGLNIFQH